ncbi:oligosaccharide repeat unit polymerase [Halanaerobium congolense]|uniref:Oligosaccharide repeat unit polymerase n=1 Tax=Halanaerobium congolense TaxID=54121 RepID=A0A4R8GQ01_9FIRM|nr:O-antigen polymerase [Halanaerobium congolense]TDX43657.1 oligosaccharide repeat unit polymerase [Halanaerobium congolense]
MIFALGLLVLLGIILLLEKPVRYHRYTFVLFFLFSLFFYYLNWNTFYKNHSLYKSNIFVLLIIFSFFVIVYFFFNTSISKVNTVYLKHPKILYNCTKITVIINVILLIFSYYILLNDKNLINIITLYTKYPYYLETNLYINPFIGNFRTLNFVSFINLIYFKIYNYKFKYLNLYIVTSFIILIADNRKGGILLLMMVCFHMFYERFNKINYFKTLFVIFLSVILLFVFSYSFYYTAGVEINIIEKIYLYLTSSFEGFSYHMSENIINVNNIKESYLLYPFLDFMQISTKENLKSVRYNFGDERSSNVGTIFLKPYLDLGYLGVIVFIIFINLMILITGYYSRINYFMYSLYLIFLSFIDFSFFGNYFANRMLITSFVGVAFYFIIYTLSINIRKVKFNE